MNDQFCPLFDNLISTYEDDDFMGEDEVADELATAATGLSVGDDDGWGPASKTTDAWELTKPSDNSGWETKGSQGDTSSGW